MDNKIASLQVAQPGQTGRSMLAEVVEVDRGEATNLYLLSLNREVNVFAHSSSVGALKVGDQVLVEVVQDQYIVTHRLRMKGERPQQGFNVNQNGELEIAGHHGVAIRCQDSRIEIQKDGRVMIDGKEIYSIADGKYRLQGATIELN